MSWLDPESEVSEVSLPMGKCFWNGRLTKGLLMATAAKSAQPSPLTQTSWPKSSPLWPSPLAQDQLLNPSGSSPESYFLPAVVLLYQQPQTCQVCLGTSDASCGQQLSQLQSSPACTPGWPLLSMLLGNFTKNPVLVHFYLFFVCFWKYLT